MKQYLFLLFSILPIISNAQVIYNFESGSITEWLEVPASRWQASNNQPLEGIFSLKHSFNNTVSSTDRISTPLPVWNIANGNIIWRFKIRYGYDPSSSNCWWVYLMSDQDANSMGNPSSCNGYVVGVNFTGTDDLLKIWQVTLGASQILLTSTLNWQTTIGTTGIGAIEVERNSDGTFNLRVSTSGDFNSLQDLGSFQDIDITDFNHFGICYKYTSSADQLLWFDDFSIDYQPLNLHDNTSGASEPTSQVGAGIISSLDTSSNTSVEIFKFKIRDLASGDNLPTRVKKLSFKKDLSITQADWINTIGGVRLFESSNEVSILNTSISDTRITLEVDSTTMTIPDGTEKEFKLKIFLNPTNLEDKSVLKFIIDKDDHGFVAGLSGSGFGSSFSNNIYSNTFQIEVVSTQIDFNDYPDIVSVNRSFSISVFGVDSSGNADIDFNKIVSLSLFEGAGILSSDAGLSKTPTNGIAEWSDLKYNHYESFSVKVECSGFDEIATEPIEVVNDSSAVAVSPTSQPDGTSISSMNNFPGNAVEVLRFKLADLGQGDGVPTYVSNIKLSRTEISDATSLYKSINGLLVKSNGILVGINEPEIKTGYINIPFSENSLVIPDNGFVDISVWVYLNSTSLIDNQKLQVKVDAVDHGFLANSNGSGFVSSFPQTITSNIFTISVNAIKLEFTSIPTRVGVEEPFDVLVTATDVNGNKDKDFAGSITISLANGDGSLAVPDGETSSMNYGELLFESMQYDTPGNFSLFVSNATLDDAVSQTIICGDNDGGIFQTSPPSKVNIPGISVSEENAVEIFSLKLYDIGSTDGQPLLPNKITLKCFNPSNTSSLSNIINGFVVKVDGIIIPISSINTYDNSYEIEMDQESIVVPDGDTIDLTVSVYLKKSGLKDKSSFQLYIPSSNHGWTTYSLGTSFENEFHSTIYGHEAIIDIEATQISFTEQPFITAYPQSLILSVESTDMYENTDVDFEDNVFLGLDKGFGFSCSNPYITLSNGIAKWEDVVLPKPGFYRFKATSLQLNNTLSEFIYCGIDQVCGISENFETILNPNWINTQDWFNSTISPIAGIKSLQHKSQNTEGVSTFSIPYGGDQIASNKLVEWNFTIRNENWDPSSDNYFYFVLAADSLDFNPNDSRGFAVGINPKSGNDLLALWQYDNGENSPIITSDFDWNENEEVAIKVGFTTKGEWLLWFKPKDSNSFIFAGKNSFYTLPVTNWCGLVFGYSASRSGLLWLDDLKVCTADYPPLIKSAKPLNLTNIEVDFTESLNHVQAINIGNYKIFDTEGNPTILNAVNHQTQVGNKVILETEPLTFGKKMLYVDGVGDSNGRFLKDSISFGLGEHSTLGYLIINEIMANPLPSVGLPEYEYIELYNPSSDTIFTSGWRLQYNTNNVVLPADTILPHQYVVLCGNSAVETLRQFGAAIGVTSFPSLLNDGMLLKLFDPYNELISFVNYYSSWYGNDTKNDGGWSLERIDFSNISEGKENWRASNSITGGSPCAVNSIAANNPDETSPKLLSYEVIYDNVILLTFSEPMDTLMLTHIVNYQVDNRIGNPQNAVLVGDIYDKIQLTFNNSFNPNETYNLCISENVKDFAGNHIENTCLIFTLPQIPDQCDIVINEVLFNPYASGVDFVEIYNRSSKWIDLAKLKLGNRNSNSNQFDQINPASDTSKLLAPLEYAVITTNPFLVSSLYHIENSNAFCWVTTMASYNNDEGNVVLLNENLEIVDEMHYTDAMHFKLLTDVKGVSLERISPELASNSISTWHSTAQSAGFATPTYKNSQFIESTIADEEFTLSPETFSPDGDGKDDFLTINFNLPEEGFVANIRVFNSTGREIKRIASNTLLGTDGILVWDGLDNNNEKAPMGIYIVYIECFNLKGEVKKYKKTCVVAEKL